MTWSRLNHSYIFQEPLPVIWQQPIAQDKPPPLITLDVICPLEHPSFVCVSSRDRSGGLGLRHHRPQNQVTDLRNLEGKIKVGKLRIGMTRLVSLWRAEIISQLVDWLKINQPLYWKLIICFELLKFFAYLLLFFSGYQTECICTLDCFRRRSDVST